MNPDCFALSKTILFYKKSFIFRDSSVVEQLAVNQLVGGSNPSRGAINSYS